MLMPAASITKLTLAPSNKQQSHIIFFGPVEDSEKFTGNRFPRIEVYATP